MQQSSARQPFLPTTALSFWSGKTLIASFPVPKQGLTDEFVEKCKTWFSSNFPRFQEPHTPCFD